MWLVHKESVQQQVRDNNKFLQTKAILDDEESNKKKVQQKEKNNQQPGEVDWKGLCQQNVWELTNHSLGS